MDTKLVRGVPYILSVPPDPRYRPFWIPAIKITRFTPDTCFCTINYSWDRRLPEAERVHTYCSWRDAARIRPDVLRMIGGRLRHLERKTWKWEEVHCEAHMGLRGVEWFEQLIAENRSRIFKKERIAIVV